MKILLRDVRLAFPNLWKATAPKGGGEMAFSASFLLAPTHKQIRELETAMKALAISCVTSDISPTFGKLAGTNSAKRRNTPLAAPM